MKTIYLVIGSILLICLVLLGYKYFLAKQPPNTQIKEINNKQEVQPTTIQPENSNQQTTDEFANWKTYTDKEGLYTLKYSTEKYFRIICPNEGFALTSNKQWPAGTTDPITQEVCGRGGPWSMEIAFSKDSTAFKPTQELSDFYAKHFTITSEKITINGVSADKLIYTPKAATPGEDTPPIGKFADILIKKGDLSYRIQIGDVDNLTYFLKVLSTFKFTN